MNWNEMSFIARAKVAWNSEKLGAAVGVFLLVILTLRVVLRLIRTGEVFGSADQMTTDFCYIFFGIGILWFVYSQAANYYRKLEPNADDDAD